MRVAADRAVTGGGSRQHISGIAGRINSDEAAIGRVERNRSGVCGTAKPEEDNAVGSSGERRVDENRAVESGLLGLVGRQVGKKALVHRSARRIRVQGI